MDDDFRRRLLRVEVDFLSAVSDGDAAVALFEETWSTLVYDLSRAVESKAIDDRTAELAQGVATRLAILADSLDDLRVKYDSLTSDLETEVQEVFEHMHLTGASNDTPDTEVPLEPEPIPGRLCPVPPYFELAYSWMMKNLHQPYPSPSVKADIARSSGTSICAVDNWCQNFRSRIGWSKIRQVYFNNDRQATVDAARCVFLQDGSESLLSRGVCALFLQMREDAARLYDQKFKQSIPTSQLCAVIQDATGGDVADVTVKKEPDLKDKRIESRELRKAQRRREAQIKRRIAAASYPSPERSICGSPAHSHISLSPSDDDFEDSDLISNASTPSHKRRRISVSTASTINRPLIDEHPCPHDKRHRPNGPPEIQDYVPLTPASTVGDLCEDVPGQIAEQTSADFISRSVDSPHLLTPLLSPVSPNVFSSIVPSPPSTPPPLTLDRRHHCETSLPSPISPPLHTVSSRKRRLSTSDSDDLPSKRPCNSRIKPCLLKPSPLPHSEPEQEFWWISAICDPQAFPPDIPLADAPYQTKQPEGKSESGQLSPVPWPMLGYSLCPSDLYAAKGTPPTLDVAAPEHEFGSGNAINVTAVSERNCLALCLYTRPQRPRHKPLSKLRLRSVSHPQWLKNFDVSHTAVLPSVHAPANLNSAPTCPLSACLGWFADMTVDASASLISTSMDCCLLCDSSIPCCRAILGANYLLLSCGDRRWKLGQIRYHEREITRLKLE